LRLSFTIGRTGRRFSGVLLVSKQYSAPQLFSHLAGIDASHQHKRYDSSFMALQSRPVRAGCAFGK